MIIVYCKNTVDLYADNGKLLKNIRDGTTALHVHVSADKVGDWLEIDETEAKSKCK